MNKHSNIFFDLISEYHDKGARAAQKSLGGLEGLAKKVSVAFAGAFAVDKIVQFGKASVDAFSKEQQAVAQLNNSFKNMGLSIQTFTAQANLKAMSDMYGIQKELLIPSMTELTRVTKSAATASDILQTALNIQAGTGQDLGTITTALSKAYYGNYSALGKMLPELNAASLKGQTFAQIQERLNKTFSGAAAAAADTYAGKINKIKIGFQDMQQSIGEGLVNAFQGLVGSGGSIDAAIGKMQMLGLAWDAVLTNMGNKAETSGLGKILSAYANAVPELINLISTGKFKTAQELATQAYDVRLRQNTQQLEQFYKNKKQQDAINAKLVAQDLAAQKAITAQKAQQLALEKAKNVLTTSAKLLDTQQAEIVAAMLNTSLSENELTRLKLKQALLNDNATAAGQFAQQLIASQVAALQLAAANPFGMLNTDIKSATSSLLELAKALAALQFPPQITQLGGLAAFQAKVAAVPSYESYASPWQFGGASADKVYQSTNSQGVTVTLIDATTGGVNAVTQNNSLNGTPATVTRYNPILDR